MVQKKTKRRTKTTKRRKKMTTEMKKIVVAKTNLDMLA